MSYDLIIRNAKLRKKQGFFDIGIEDLRIKTISESIKEKAVQEIDAKGRLATESFVNGHLHLCKVYTLKMISEDALKYYQGSDMGAAMTAIEEASKVKEKYSEELVINNATKAVKLAALNGVTHIRAFADVDSKAKLIGLKGLLKVRDAFKDIVEIQVVAFPQDGVVREEGAEELIQEAMKLGADVVGGIPWIEYTEEDEKAHINKMFKIAKEFDKPVAMLVDDAGDPTLKTLEMMAKATIEYSLIGKTCACHARAMQLYPEPYFKKVSALLKKAEMGVISDPHTGPLHARVKELLKEGNLVALGQDDITDAYYPFGRNNMLEVAFLASHLLWMTTYHEMEELYNMITVNAAKAIGIKNHEIKEGNVANIVVLDEEDVWEALRNHKEPLYTISHGRLIDKEKYKV